MYCCCTDLRASESIHTFELSQTPRVDTAKTFQVIASVSSHDITYSENSEGSDYRERLQDASIGRRNLHLEFDEAHSDNNASGSSDEAYIDSDGSASANSIEDAEENVADNDDIGESTEDTDDLNTFAAFESGAENDDGEDDDASVVGLDAADVQLSAPPEMRFSPDARAVMDSTISVHTAWLNEMGINVWSDLQTHVPYDYLMVPYEPRPASSMATDYPNLYAGESGPTPNIPEQTNDYFETNLDERVQGQLARQVARQKQQPEFKPKTPELIKSMGVTARELCIFVGLLIVRSIVSNKEKLAHHWKPTDEGALPRGCFGQFMTRDRFMHISRNLHFSRNDDERAAKDRAWKLRPVIDALQGRFAAGFMPPAVMAFDEAMLPSRSTFNKMRVRNERRRNHRRYPSRQANIERGTFIVTDALEIPGMRLLRWWDTRAVHMLTTGASVEMDRIVRRDKLTGTQSEVACPRVVKDYQTFMGGVDVHDQLRLQRYSLQLCLKYKKYYKSLFLGLVDLAIINANIIFSARRAHANLPKVRHVKFMKQLHLEWCQLREEDWISLRSDETFQVTPRKSNRSQVAASLPTHRCKTMNGALATMAWDARDAREPASMFASQGHGQCSRWRFVCILQQVQATKHDEEAHGLAGISV
ncbi:unnamed protein product [Phytophthora fragariaefolia]|uniref:Unnamed protein product n=1 Tax=Phytophthora fragariaefolia TaxID=1490495 RepID=A0A9W6Y1M5_9STRA|nr:unnamed protein product [Phytophthora fragariaefolia]